HQVGLEVRTGDDVGLGLLVGLRPARAGARALARCLLLAGGLRGGARRLGGGVLGESLLGGSLIGYGSRLGRSLLGCRLLGCGLLGRGLLGRGLLGRNLVLGRSGRLVWRGGRLGAGFWRSLLRRLVVARRVVLALGHQASISIGSGFWASCGWS